MRFPLLTSFCGSLLIFLGCAYLGHRATIAIVYRHQESKWFGSLQGGDADRLRRAGQATLAYELSVLTIQNTLVSLQTNTSSLAKIRKTAPQGALARL